MRIIINNEYNYNCEQERIYCPNSVGLVFVLGQWAKVLSRFNEAALDGTKVHDIRGLSFWNFTAFLCDGLAAVIITETKCKQSIRVIIPFILIE